MKLGSWCELVLRLDGPALTIFTLPLPGFSETSAGQLGHQDKVPLEPQHKILFGEGPRSFSWSQKPPDMREKHRHTGGQTRDRQTSR